jgi:hypothetical protein
LVPECEWSSSDSKYLITNSEHPGRRKNSKKKREDNRVSSYWNDIEADAQEEILEVMAGRASTAVVLIRHRRLERDRT